uniref:Uncharacterized protein n=1 Tax=Lactuca sativa TaxID=4236 RepID=A0A9R1WA89_LACSA|nr:hypothetical protein LSAT_V11C300114350 [Lactuca sativa]
MIARARERELDLEIEKKMKPEGVQRGSEGKKPKGRTEVPVTKSRAFQLTAEEARTTPDVVTGSFLVNGIAALIWLVYSSFIVNYHCFKVLIVTNLLDMESREEELLQAQSQAQSHSSVQSNV